MRTVVDIVTYSHVETVARRRFGDLSLETKAPVNHGQALVAERSGRKGASGTSHDRKSDNSSNGGIVDRKKDTSAGSRGPRSRKERRTCFWCDQPGHIKENCTARLIRPLSHNEVAGAGTSRSSSGET